MAGMRNGMGKKKVMSKKNKSAKKVPAFLKKVKKKK